MIPLGIDKVVSGRVHGHPISSSEVIDEKVTRAPLLPPSRELLAGLAIRSIRKIPEGLVIMYLGNDSPPGWADCDGSYDTPDLSGLYIRLRAASPATDVVGKIEHSHVVHHRHVWSAGQAVQTDDRGLAFDTISNGGSKDGKAAAFTHEHVGDESAIDVPTTVARNLPKSIAVRFLVSKANGAKMPKGALIPYDGPSGPPWGWDLAEFEPATLFLRGRDAEFLLGSQFGNTAHTHTAPHVHRVNLAQSAAAPFEVQTAASGSAVAAATHAHLVDVHGNPSTSEASTFPPYVALPLIKKR